MIFSWDRKIDKLVTNPSGIPCSECRGEGHIFYLKEKCTGCHGRRVQLEKKVLDIVVPAGSAKETQLKFAGAADQLPGTNAGDVIVIIAEVSHPVFERNGQWESYFYRFLFLF